MYRNFNDCRDAKSCVSTCAFLKLPNASLNCREICSYLYGFSVRSSDFSRFLVVDNINGGRLKSSLQTRVYISSLREWDFTKKDAKCAKNKPGAGKSCGCRATSLVARSTLKKSPNSIFYIFLC